MIKYRIFAFTMLFVMVFNISKYQIPQVQYGIFKDYIAKNLCVNKNVKNSCCHGKCFLKKQIKMVAETNSDTENRHNKKATNNEEQDFLCSYFFRIKPVEVKVLRLANLEVAQLQGYASLIFVPPKAEENSDIIVG
ncbi:MAG: hypothetical protein Q8928_16980 [Bacteroidota bacterium]|nr:hypothetical protein [Bacteroidota bacterium]